MAEDTKAGSGKKLKRGWGATIAVLTLLSFTTPAFAVNGDPLCGVISE
jgi:hypothetical protein